MTDGQKQLAALVLGGVVATAAGIAIVNMGEKSLTKPDGWSPRAAKCIRGLGLTIPADGGMHSYAMTRVCTEVLEDGGESANPLPADLMLVDERRADVVAFDGGEPVQLEAGDAFECACSDRKGKCEQLLADGGWVEAFQGQTLAVGQWRGAGCVRKPCSEVAGFTSWPKECP